ncbi:MAG: hypothetical protein ACW98X_23785 [Promethearchaeota archaeon]|jgi:ABC-type sugar transport system ATPase subunit
MSNLIGENSFDKHAKKLQDCRDIVRTILDYGVDQFQIVRIIKLLSLEIDNREDMIALNELCKSIEEREGSSMNSIIKDLKNKG